MSRPTLAPAAPPMSATPMAAAAPADAPKAVVEAAPETAPPSDETTVKLSPGAMRAVHALQDATERAGNRLSESEAIERACWTIATKAFQTMEGEAPPEE